MTSENGWQILKSSTCLPVVLSGKIAFNQSQSDQILAAKCHSVPFNVIYFEWQYAFG